MLQAVPERDAGHSPQQTQQTWSWSSGYALEADVTDDILEQLGFQPKAFRTWYQTSSHTVFPTCLEDYISSRFLHGYGTALPTHPVSKEDFVQLVGLMPDIAEIAEKVVHKEIDPHEGPAYNVFVMAIEPSWIEVCLANGG